MPGMADCAGMLGAIGHGLQSLTAGFDRLDRTAASIARDAESARLATNAADLLRARQEVRAGVAVLRAADELTGTILDVFA
jgi:hypothetical protein